MCHTSGPEPASYQSLAVLSFRSWKKMTREFRARRGNFSPDTVTTLMEIMGATPKVGQARSGLRGDQPSSATNILFALQCALQLGPQIAMI